MKKVISFDHEILFPTMIGEITAISLDHNLEFVNKNNIEGEFNISGRYKMTEASAIEEDFDYHLPVEINLVENLEKETSKIEIQDFTYEVIDEEMLKTKIDVVIEGVEEIEEEKEEQEVREEKEDIITMDEKQIRKCDGDEKSLEEKIIDVEPILEDDSKEDLEPIEIIQEENLEEIENKKEEVTDTLEKEDKKSLTSIFRVFNDAEETYKAYTVYIMRKNDSLTTILDRYKVTKEQLEEYNDLANLEIGSKIIIPTIND